MIRAIVPSDAEFCLYKARLKTMYEEAKEKICDTNSFEFIVRDTLFSAFTDENGDLLGAIYFFVEDEKLFMNAYAGRGHHKENLESVMLATTWFSCDIYAEAQNKASALCLLRCGFKRVKDKLFVYKQVYDNGETRKGLNYDI